ncbi:M48 family metalloprotease [Nostoc sp. NMS4]|uniref:M48 family metalloprotease n=1 Tax=Nostoc sp. NMS4 TaxID=2815390 RepID=UPI00343C3008
MNLALRRPHSRQDKFEADRRGLKTLGCAGYAQSAMIAFMQKLLNQPSVPTFLSTHPATSDSFANVFDERITALISAIHSQNAYKCGGLNNTVYEEKIQPLS